MAEVKSTTTTTTTERVVGVNGNMMTVEFSDRVMQNEVAFAKVGDARLKCEVIRVRGNRADLQVFESTNGLKVGDEVEFTGELLSVELGPGLLTQVYDGANTLVPVTVIEAGPCPVTQIKTAQSDGYEAVQIGFGAQKTQRMSKPELGHLKKAGAEPLRKLAEFRVENASEGYPGTFSSSGRSGVLQ